MYSYSSEHFSTSFSPDIGTENMVLLREVWTWNEFERFVVFSTIRLEGDVNFFIREFSGIFNIPSDFTFPGWDA